MTSEFTPIAILHEVAGKNNLTPLYQLIYSRYEGNDPLFKYSVKVGELCGFGSGCSKKEAKHDAAYILLKRMECTDCIEDPKIVNAIKNIDTQSQILNVSRENFVGQLLDLCMTHYLPEPVYTLENSGTIKNEYVFVTSCVVSNHFEISSSRTKKQSKQMVAKQMFNRLTAILNCLKFSTQECENIFEKKMMNSKLGLKLSNYDKFLNGYTFICNPSPTLTDIQDKNLDWINNHSSPEKLLEKILQELNFSLEIKSFKKVSSNVLLQDNDNLEQEMDYNEQIEMFPSNIKENREMNSNSINTDTEIIFCVLLEIKNSFPQQIFTGIGNTDKDALRKANLNALAFYFYMYKAYKPIQNE